MSFTRFATHPVFAAFEVVNLLRHPVSYIESHAALVLNSRAVPEAFAHYQDMFAAFSSRFPALLRLREALGDEVIAFSVSVASVLRGRADLELPDYLHIPVEKLTSDPTVLQAFCQHLTGLDYDLTDLETYVGAGRVNAHRRQWRSVDESVAQWDAWQTELFSLAVPQELVEMYANAGYDVDILRALYR